MNDSFTGIIVLGAFIALNAALKVAYVSIINANKGRLKDMADEGNSHAERALALSSDATRMLASQQLMDLLLRFAIALVAAVGVAPPLHDTMVQHLTGNMVADGVAYGGVMLIVMILTMVFGEMLPSNIALGHSESIAMRSVGLVSGLSRVLAPILHLMQWISNQFATPFVGRTSMTLVTEEEIKMLVDAGSEGGSIENEEKEMIYSIFQFGDTLAREVMVPRIDVVSLEINTPLHEALNTMVEAGHSRIPVYEESIDHIRGLLYAKDLLMVWRNGETDRPIKGLLRPAHFVPESKKADDLLADMQQRKVHLAIVVDEYGGTAGLVTLEDLIEEIVGEIRDEYDFNEEEVYQKIGENEYIFDAGIDLDDLNRLLDTDLPTEDSDTLGGFIFSKLGEVPVEGEKIEIEEEHLLLEVLSVDDRRLRKIRVTRVLPKEEPTDIREEPAPEAD